MVSFEEAVRAVDEVVQECLESAHITQPAVDPVTVAEALGMRTQFDSALPGRGERRTVNGRGIILIRPEKRNEREHFSIAHEIGEEVACGRILERLDLLSEADRFREPLANQFAGRLLCPSHWLQRSIAAEGVDLRRLKQEFATASHEVIARQLLSLEEPNVITVIDNGSVRLRRGNFGWQRDLHRVEALAWQECFTTAADVDRAQDGLRVQAWAIHEDNWRREILRTTRLDA